MNVSFPYRFDAQGRTTSATAPEHARDLIEQVLFTMPGERVMRPTFGSGLAQMVFQPSSSDLAAAVELMVQGNLQQFLGDLIVVESVQVTSDESAVEVTVQYTMRRTQQRHVDKFTHQV